MIFSVGTDIAKVSRFEKWVRNPDFIKRFFNPAEIGEELKENEKNLQYLAQHYAARFAAKEAFSKALGTGFAGLSLSDFGIVNNKEGKPDFLFGEKTESFVRSIVGESYRVHVTLSHEKEFAVAFVVIEK